MNVLIIGYGSIGKRHARILSEMGHSVSLVTKQVNLPFKSYQSIREAVAHGSVEYVVVSNISSKHLETLIELNDLGFTGKVLVEKPLFIQTEIDSEVKFNFESVHVGFDLRFHPCVQELKAYVSQQKPISAQIYVGQYLPTWRPQTDYRNCYSAKRSEGGGVLWDLCHELDYLSWIFGDWKRLTAIGGKYSELQIDSDDSFSVLLETQNCPMISLELNYLDRLVHRRAIVNTSTATIEMDLINSTLLISDGKSREVVTRPVESDFIYKQQHSAIINGNSQYLCTYKEGLSVIDTVIAIEESSKSGKWINNE